MEENCEISVIDNVIPERHVPYCLENGDLITENNIILIIDQHDGQIYACQATVKNLRLLKIIPSFPNFSDSPVPISSVSQKSKELTESSGTKWSKDAVLFLIEQWKQNSSKFANTTIRNEEVWKDIAQKLEDAGFTGYKWKNVQDKWKNIRKAYMKVKDNMGNNSSGAARVTCKYFNELDEVFAKSPSVTPLSIASSRNFTDLPSCSKNMSMSHEDSDSNSDLLTQEKENQPKIKKTKLEKDTFTWISTLRDDASKREVAREERHKQTLNILNKFIDSHEALMKALIDKL